jgi:hypothetical protein
MVAFVELATGDGLVYKRYVLEPGASKYYVRKILEELISLSKSANVDALSIHYVCNVRQRIYFIHNVKRIKLCGNDCERCERCYRLDRLARKIR